eukprot:6209061-Pleurochrysis_carterae.AAC.2
MLKAEEKCKGKILCTSLQQQEKAQAGANARRNFTRASRKLELEVGGMSKDCMKNERSERARNKSSREENDRASAKHA